MNYTTNIRRACTHEGGFKNHTHNIPRQRMRLAGRYWVTEFGAAFSAETGEAADQSVIYRLDLDSIRRIEQLEPVTV